MPVENSQELLKKYILILATSITGKEEILNLIKELKKLYANSFRHTYSEFFPIIVDIHNSPKEYSLEYLSNNLEELKKIVFEQYQSDTEEDKNFKSVINKLCDHLNLEIARYNYYLIKEQRVESIETRIKDAQETTRKIEKENNKIIKKSNKANKKLKSVQTELITVLSIFSAIILTFSFGVSSFSSVFNNIKDAPFLKSTFFILLCGFIMINLLFAMMYFISKITDRNIYARCKTENCTCENICKGLTRIKKRLPYIFYLNVAILSLMFISASLNIITFPKTKHYIARFMSYINTAHKNLHQNKVSKRTPFYFSLYIE